MKAGADVTPCRTRRPIEICSKNIHTRGGQRPDPTPRPSQADHTTAPTHRTAQTHSGSRGIRVGHVGGDVGPSGRRDCSVAAGIGRTPRRRQHATAASKQTTAVVARRGQSTHRIDTFVSPTMPPTSTTTTTTATMTAPLPPASISLHRSQSSSNSNARRAPTAARRKLSFSPPPPPVPAASPSSPGQQQRAAKRASQSHQPPQAHHLPSVIRVADCAPGTARGIGGLEEALLCLALLLLCAPVTWYEFNQNPCIAH